jgi:hypothetical protein
MTIEQPISPTLADAHQTALDDANRWRGSCTEKFARIDQAVAEALEAMAAKEPNANVRTPHLFGQRIAAFRAALQPGKPLPAKSGQVLKALDKLEPYLAKRNILVHATGSVWVNAKGGWLWRYCVTPSGRNRVQDKGAIDRTEAHGIEKTLGPLCHSFCDLLRNFSAS